MTNGSTACPWMYSCTVIVLYPKRIKASQSSLYLDKVKSRVIILDQLVYSLDGVRSGSFQFVVIVNSVFSWLEEFIRYHKRFFIALLIFQTSITEFSDILSKCLSFEINIKFSWRHVAAWSPLFSHRHSRHRIKVFHPALSDPLRLSLSSPHLLPQAHSSPHQPFQPIQCSPWGLCRAFQAYRLLSGYVIR